MPVVLGSGSELFADGSAPHSFQLERTPNHSHSIVAGGLPEMS